MRVRIALISLLVLSSGTVASGVNYIDRDAILPRDTIMATPRESDAKVQQQREHQPLRIAPRSQTSPPDVRPGIDPAETTREKKTLAVLLLMLRDGRGAR